MSSRSVWATNNYTVGHNSKESKNACLRGRGSYPIIIIPPTTPFCSDTCIISHPFFRAWLMLPLQTWPCITNHFIWGHACFCVSEKTPFVSKDNSERCFQFGVQLHKDQGSTMVFFFLFLTLLEYSFISYHDWPKSIIQFFIAPIVVCHYCLIRWGKPFFSNHVLIADALRADEP